MICRFCGMTVERDLLHVLTCDGRQGRVEFEAAIEARAMAEEPPVLDRAGTHRAAERGIAQAEAHAPDEYLALLQCAIYEIARVQPSLTSDDVWARVGVHQMHTGNPSALGAAFRLASRAGWIRRGDGRSDSIRPATHGRPLREWKSLIYIQSDDGRTPTRPLRSHT
jgi:hypothetical protein